MLAVVMAEGALAPKKLRVHAPAAPVVPNGSEAVLAILKPVSKPAVFVINGKRM